MHNKAKLAHVCNYPEPTDAVSTHDELALASAAAAGVAPAVVWLFLLLPLRMMHSVVVERGPSISTLDT